MHHSFDGPSNTWKRQAGWLIAAAGVLTLGGCLGGGGGGPRQNATPTPGGNLTPLPTPTGTLTPQPTPTPGVPGLTGRITFASTRDGNSEIYILDSFETQRITKDSGAFAPVDTSPVLSPNRSRLAWVSNRRETNSTANDTEIIIADATGANQSFLTTNSVNDIDPAFSPNNNQIAFARSVNNVNQIFIANVDGSGVQQVTTNGGVQPFFSRDGSKIVFSADRVTNGVAGTALYTINLDGSNEQVLVDDPNGIERNPHWSPVGDRVLYSVRPLGQNQVGTNSSIRVVTVNADGTAGTDTELVPATSSNVDPTWSPNASQICFASNRDALGTGTYRLYRQNPTPNATATRLEVNSPGSDTEPDWR